ncbi:MAG: glycosyltransferase family 9 protein [Alphaproteobacteria bacterium]|nr:glycosyltransferase family 9 protein [Alphaproteobacteria bacterium]
MNKALRRIVRLIRSLAFALLDFGAIASARKIPAEKPSAAIFCLHGMGDLLLALPMIDTLVKAHKARGFSVYLYVNEDALELAQHIRGIDHIIIVRRDALMRDLAYRWKSLRDIAARGHQAAVQPTYNRFFIIEDALMQATGSAEKTGSSGSPMFISSWERFFGDRWYGYLTPCVPQPMHEIDRNKEFLTALGLSSDDKELELPATLLSPSKSEEDRFVLMNIRASHSLKSWPADRFEELAHLVARETGRRIVFAGSPDNARPGKSFKNWDSRFFVDDVGKTDLRSLVKRIADADLVVANDSVVMHLAVFMRRKVVAIAGGGIPVRYHPYPQGMFQPITVEEPMPCFGCGWRCKYVSSYEQAAPCLQAIPAARVAQIVLRELAANAQEPRR